MNRRIARRLGALALIPLVVYLAFLLAILVAMHQPVERFGRVMSYMPGPAFMVIPFEPMWNIARGGNLEVGDQAPDFTLHTVDQKHRESGEQVRLSAFRGQQPVVLVFGSYTWPPFRREVPALNEIYRRYGDRAAFFVVYIREAHPSDIWQMTSNVRDQVVYESPRNQSERADLAGVCVRNLGIEMPALVDGFDNATDAAYSGWPDRLYIVGRDGRIAYKSNPGPFGFKPDELERALAGLVGGTVAQ